MELGQKIRQARLEAGLSQRQLCAGEITRNMLSQIENGSARPSMDTLRFLASRLEKPVSYFLEDQAVTSPNQQVMEQARAAFRGGDCAAAAEILSGYREPDEVFDEERGLLCFLCWLALARQALAQDRLPLARQLLAQAESARTAYRTQALEQELLLLKAALQPRQGLARQLACDGVLLEKAADALEQEDAARCLEYLSAAEDKTCPRWNLLRGHAYFILREYALAMQCYRWAEEAYPRQVYSRLEVCCRELGDYKMAYEYACRQRA